MLILCIGKSPAQPDSVVLRIEALDAKYCWKDKRLSAGALDGV